MKKTIILLLLCACSMIAKADPPSKYYIVSATNIVGYVVIQTTNIGITTSQTTSPGVTESWTNTAPGGYYTNPSGQFSYGAYWSDPTLFTPVTIQVLSGYTATVYNANSGSQSVRIGLAFTKPNGTETYFYGPSVTVGYGQTATASIPAGAYTYTAALPIASGEVYPTPMRIFLTYGD
ncbi:MAG: hypothetical protein H6Q26_1222 [Bacteroidetes bacterium]|uniref:hypothetical protein n=1 Tax=unclassified Chitinophaga TaxID=2619133 RepID=UPI0011807831|nr:MULTISPECIES: hypothetical protein [unclassified Chitinophaga]MBP1651065.1 hypothetical protein [Bacteroidota bacterium]WPV64201.1 hypothetical protein QQL36_20575 [Chitinophaga sp. LS1]